MSRSRQLQATRSTLAAAEFFKRINYTLTCKLLLTFRHHLVHGLVSLQLAVERGPLATIHSLEIHKELERLDSASWGFVKILLGSAGELQKRARHRTTDSMCQQ